MGFCGRPYQYPEFLLRHLCFRADNGEIVDVSGDFERFGLDMDYTVDADIELEIMGYGPGVDELDERRPLLSDLCTDRRSKIFLQRWLPFRSVLWPFG